MKSLQQYSIGSLVFLIILTSCSVEKRHYMSGFNIEWKKGESGVIQNEDNIQTVSKLKKNTVPDADLLGINDGALSASSDKAQQIVLPKKEKTNLTLINKLQTADKEEQSELTFNSELKKGLKILSAPKDEQKTHGLAVASMILGILSLITFYGALLFGVLAIIFGAIALNKIKTNPEAYKGKGMAKAGLICGIVALGLIIIIIASL